MLSYLEIRQKDNLFAKCELEFIWTIESQKKDYLTSESRVLCTTRKIQEVCASKRGRRFYGAAR